MIDNLKRTLILAASTLAICIVPALATPIPTCDNTTDNLASVYLVTGYECQVGDKIFSDFQYTPSGNAAVAADEVTVEGIGPAGTAGIGLTSTLFPNDYGLQFAAPWTANSGQNSDALISFVV